MVRIRFKKSVRFKEWTATNAWILSCVVKVAKTALDVVPNEIWVTSMNDSEHLPDSRHYKDEAIDLRSKNFSTLDKKLRFVSLLLQFLNDHPARPGAFVVLFENEGTDNEHFHVQPREGIVF